MTLVSYQYCVRSTLVTVAALALLAAPAGTAQIRSVTEVVPIYATVQDKELRLVPNLTREDFVITDNGRERPITIFSNEVMPFSVVILLDRSGSMVRQQYVVRDAAYEFINRLLPADQARIGTFGDHVGNRVVINPPHFTSSHGELKEVLAAPARWGSHSPVWIAVDQAVTALASQVGRKIVVMFSDGDDAPAETLLPVKLKGLIERVRKENVMVYSLGFVDFEPRVGREPRIIPPDEGLRELAEDSGGGYFEVTRETDLNALFTRVADELHRQYVMGFEPQADGKVHTIKVTVRKPGLTVRARQTYQARSAK